MAKLRTTLTIDEAVLRAVKLRAARTGRGDSEVIEEALRRDWGTDVLDQRDMTAVDLPLEVTPACLRALRGATSSSSTTCR
jgi:hypothetical protein